MVLVGERQNFQGARGLVLVERDFLLISENLVSTHPCRHDGRGCCVLPTVQFRE